MRRPEKYLELYVRRLKNSEVRDLNNHRLNVDQEERTKRLLVDVVQTFGQKLALFGWIIFQLTSDCFLLATPTPLILPLPQFVKALRPHPAKTQHRKSLGNDVPDFRRHLSP
jgi:hypothetical protein